MFALKFAPDKADQALTMTISQSSPSCGSKAGLAEIGGRSLLLAGPLVLLRRFAAWQERRRAAADLARLAATGDYLLRDIGLDPSTAHNEPGTALDYLMRRRWNASPVSA